MRPVLLMVLALFILPALAACSAAPGAGPGIAFEDCYNRPPLYRSEHGCDEGGDR